MLSLGAINKLSGEYVYPKIANKKDEYICPECSKDLIFKQGNKRVHHFAHYKTNNPCSYYTHPTETQIHKDAKMLLKTLLNNDTEIIISRNCRCCKKTEKYEIPERDKMSKIEVEYRFHYNGIKIADIAYLDNNEIVAIFEICYTHKTDKENRPEPWFEIDAFTLINIANISEIQVFEIPCIRNELCDKCIEQNTCKGFGECLLQIDNNKYKKNVDFQCLYNCKPIKCQTKYCDCIAPAQYFNCRSGICVNCDMGIEPLRIIMLDVPFSKKNEVKRFGAKYDYCYKKWYIWSNNKNKDTILSNFKEWICPY